METKTSPKIWSSSSPGYSKEVKKMDRKEVRASTYPE